ncbi:hypothetical protein AOQ84DRAFT_438036 [Glonium stellatum]|uniref:Uncharacterized protein n=1 Tax=Glonium stellatum TaxID=574774 RepID=A0A8E2F5I5_9PEZI|nr:hypothetical protein AOQ84DRAFT_438036 [Glonium stellatum]
MKPSGPDDGEPGQSDKQAGEDHSQTPNQLITGDETPHNADFHSGSPKRDQPHQLEPDATGSSETKPWTNIPRNNSEVDQSGTPDQPNGSGPSVQSQAVESFAETLVPPANGNTDNTQ